MKKRHFCLLLCLFLFGFAGKAQDTTLQKILAAKDDSAKLIRLADYAYRFANTDTAKAQRLYTELLQLSKKLNYPYWIGESWFGLAYVQVNRGNDMKAIENYRIALQYLKGTNRVDRVADCYLSISAAAERLGDVDLKLADMNKAINLLEGTRYKKQLSGAYNNMGVMLYNQEQYAKGLPFFQKAMLTARDAKDTIDLVMASFGISNCLSSLERFAEAEVSSREALRLATLSGNNYQLKMAHLCAAELYLKWGKAEPAIRHAENLLHYSEGNDAQFQLIGLMDLGGAYALTSETAKTITYLNQALQLAQKIGYVTQLHEIYRGLSEAYAKQGNYKQSLEYYKKHIAFRDSTINERNNKNIAELEIKYQTSQKEKALAEQKFQLAQKDLQLQKNRNYMYYTLTALVVALLVVALLVLRSKHKKRLHQKEVKAIQQQKELQLLQALMQGEEKERSRIAKDLHDGVAGMLAAVKMHFSSLPAVDDLLRTEGYQQGMKLLNEATQEIRKTSHNLMPEVLLQHGLDEALRRYCGNVTNSRTLQIEYDSWGGIDRFNDGFELSVYRIVQELINNIIKHSKATQAMVQLTQQQDLLSITIEDNGVGLANDSSKEGMGLRSLQSRIHAMNGKLEVESSGQSGVSAYLEFEISDLKKESLQEA